MLIDHEMLLGMNGRFAPKVVALKFSWPRSGRIRRYNTVLAIERRGGRVGGGPAMLVRPFGKDHPLPWNKGLLVGQKRPLQPKHVWSIRVRLEIARMWRDLALFNLAIDSKLRACDLVKLRIDEVCSGTKVRDRATVVQKKTDRQTGALRDYGADEGLP